MGTCDGAFVVYPIRCNTWKCRRCAERLTQAWSFRVADAVPERMVTFTKIGLCRDDINRGLQLVIRKIRKLGFRFEYWGVVELHRSGLPHMHLLQRGRFIPKFKLKEICEEVGWGHSDIRRLSSGWKAARYCVKHLGHSHGRRWDGRLIRYSRGFFPETKKEIKARNHSHEWKWAVVFQRADIMAEMLRAGGVPCDVPEMGMDLIGNEVVKNGKAVQWVDRRYGKGYNLPITSHKSMLELLGENGMVWRRDGRIEEL